MLRWKWLILKIKKSLDSLDRKSDRGERNRGKFEFGAIETIQNEAPHTHRNTCTHTHSYIKMNKAAVTFGTISSDLIYIFGA